MKRVLALDLGTKTLGLCISDPLKITTNPVENYKFKEDNFQLALDRVVQEVKNNKEQIETLVLGYPLRLTGTKSEFTLKVEDFHKELKNKFPNINIVLEDERNTSKQSMAIMKSQNIKSKNKKANIDKVAACIILKNYLDRLQ